MAPNPTPKITLILSNCDIALKRSRRKGFSAARKSAEEDEDQIDEAEDVALTRIHQALLIAADSPLRKAGLLDIYVHTLNRQIIELHSELRLPRTFRVFKKLLVKLYAEPSGTIRSAEDVVLMKILGNEAISQMLKGGSEDSATETSPSTIKRTTWHVAAKTKVVTKDIVRNCLGTEAMKQIETLSSDTAQGGPRTEAAAYQKLATEMIRGCLIEVCMSNDITVPILLEGTNVLKLSDFALEPVVVVNRICNAFEEFLEIEGEFGTFKRSAPAVPDWEPEDDGSSEE